MRKKLVKSVVFMPWGNGHGHLARCISLASVARAASYDAAIAVTNSEQRRLVEVAGITPWVYPEEAIPEDPWTAWYDESFIERSISVDIDCIRGLNADVVVHDGRLSAPIAAWKSNIECVGLVQSVNLPGFIYPGKLKPEELWTDATGGFNEVMSNLGIAMQVRDIRELFVEGAAAIPSVEEIDPVPLGALTSSIEYVGPITSMSNITREPNTTPSGRDRSAIFFYRTANDLERLDEFRDVFGKMGAQVLIATGDPEVARRLEERLPTDIFEVRDFWSMRQVKERARAAIIHGGHGTCLTCLQAGIPMVILSDGSPERKVNGHRVQDANAGRCLDPASPNVEAWNWSNQGRTQSDIGWSDVKTVLDQVLADQSIEDSAKSWSIRLNDYNMTETLQKLLSSAKLPFVGSF